MTKLALTFASCKYDRMEALRCGEVTVEGIDLNMLVFPAGREIFDRMIGGQEFDVAELSASEFISVYGRGDCPFVALPVFPSRIFRHGFIFVNTASGIRTAKDLEGRRVGVPLYTQTAAIWARGLLADEFGVDLDRIDWVQGAVEQAGSHGRPSAPPLLRPARIEVNSSGASLSQMLAAGEIDAYLGSRKIDGIGRDLRIARLIPDYRAAERAYFGRTGVFPIMHLVAIRRALYERHPWIATSLYKAFVASKQRALARLRYGGSLGTMLPWQLADVDEIDEVFGGDPFPYGVEPNRPTLDALLRHMTTQHFIRAGITVDELFVPVRGGVGS